LAPHYASQVSTDQGSDRVGDKRIKSLLDIGLGVANNDGGALAGTLPPQHGGSRRLPTARSADKQNRVGDCKKVSDRELTRTRLVCTETSERG